LSNFYFVSIKYGGQSWFSSEQIFQFQKARIFKDSKAKLDIRNSKSSMEAKAIGKRVKGFNPLVWAGQSINVMKEILQAKFEYQGGELSEGWSKTGGSGIARFLGHVKH
jgi:ribA/ribD-fused uncharacterized protein